MYVDKLDGRIDAEFFDRKAAEWRSRQTDVMLSIDRHQAASKSYLDEGIRLLELASRARELFEAQEPREQRRLLDFVLSNCSWKDGQLDATFRQPFDLLAVTASSAEGVESSKGAPGARFEKWLPEPNGFANFRRESESTLLMLPGRVLFSQAVRFGTEQDPNSNFFGVPNPTEVRTIALPVNRESGGIQPPSVGEVRAIPRLAGCIIDAPERQLDAAYGY